MKFSSTHMKIASVLTALVASAASSVTFASDQVTLVPASDNGPQVTMERGSLITPPEVGATHVFRMVDGYQGEQQARELAQRLFAATKVPQTVTLQANMDASVLMHVNPVDPSCYFQIDTTTGDFSFCKGMLDYSGENDTPGLPGKRQAVTMALRHLDGLGLMPANADELTLQHIGGLNMGARGEDGSVAEYTKLVTVHFGRRLDGIPVTGPGSKIVVQLGANGELVSLHRRWIETQARDIAANEFLSEREAVDGIAGHLSREWSEAMRVDADLPEVGYFDDGHGLIEPAYIFTADLTYDPTIHEFAAQPGYEGNYFGIQPALRTAQAHYRQQKAAPQLPADPDSPVVDDPMTVDE